jgi:hypothetical protein
MHRSPEQCGVTQSRNAAFVDEYQTINNTLDGRSKRSKGVCNNISRSAEGVILRQQQQRQWHVVTMHEITSGILGECYM